MSWKNELANLLNIDVDQADKMIKDRKLHFSEYFELGQAIEREDREAVQDILRSAEKEQELEEQDNPYQAATKPTTATMPTKPTTATKDLAPRKEPGDLKISDRVRVRDLSGNEVDGTVRRKGPGDTWVVQGSKGDSVVRPEDILQTPEMTNETTTAGAIATVPVSIGAVIKRGKPEAKTRNGTPRKKKK